MQQAKNFSTQKKSGYEQMSGATAEISFIDAPPIPYNKKYRADIRNSSAASDLLVSSPAKIEK